MSAWLKKCTEMFRRWYTNLIINTIVAQEALPTTSENLKPHPDDAPVALDANLKSQKTLRNTAYFITYNREKHSIIHYEMHRQAHTEYPAPEYFRQRCGLLERNLALSDTSSAGLESAHFICQAA